jgi:16S rRNA (guanine527-N7)-methyltransferase
VNSAAFTRLLSDRAHQHGIVIDAHLASGLDAYFQLLRRWNRRVNLTGLNLEALTTPGLDRLFIEPLIAAQYVASGAELIDLGSGGGSPAIPLALGSTAASLTMVESRTRKSVFLREAAREVGLSATVLTTRFQNALENETLRGAFDALSCRALRLDRGDLASVALFVKPGGRLFLFRSLDMPPDEPPAGLLLNDTHPLPGGTSELLVLRR